LIVAQAALESDAALYRQAFPVGPVGKGARGGNVRMLHEPFGRLDHHGAMF